MYDKNFPEIYNLAFSYDILITISTNGSLLSKKGISNLLEAKPPYRLTVSMYGASKGSYESLTQRRGSFEQFLSGLDWAKRKKIRTRLNIIVTKYNEKEVKEMINLAKNHSFEYFVFYSLSPTIYGNKAPIQHEATCQEKKNKANNEIYIPCQAGKTSFHVNSRGNASLCKTIRTPIVNLIENGEQSFEKLKKMANMLFNKKTGCDSCELRKQCATCPLLYKFFKKSGHVPPSICGKNK